MENKEELKIVECLEDKQIALIKDSFLVLQTVAKWRLYLGMPKEDQTTELALVRDFIMDNYSHLTLKEIELAYNLAATNKLDNCEYYGFFSPFYVGKVLDTYLYYRKRTMAEAIRRKEKYNYVLLEEKNKPKPEEECILTKELFLDFYKQHTEGKDITDVFNFCWKYLRKQNKINPKKEEYEPAIAYAKEKYKKIKDENFFFSRIKNEEEEEEIKKLARNYCVQRFFEKVDINEFVNTIKPEHFS